MTEGLLVTEGLPFCYTNFKREYEKRENRVDNHMIIEIDGIQVNVTKKNIRNMHLYVKPPDGCVEVTAPYLMSSTAIRMFVMSKAAWIREKQAVFAGQSRKPELQFVSGEVFYLWGRKYILNVKYGGRNSLVINGDEAVLTVRESSTPKQREARVNEWYRARLKEQIEILLPKWSAITGLTPSSWQTKNMTTRWGTCNTKTGKIWINLQLAKKPTECLEYIILHELAHLKVRNHGKDFKAILDRYMPNWRQVRKILQKED